MIAAEPPRPHPYSPQAATYLASVKQEIAKVRADTIWREPGGPSTPPPLAPPPNGLHNSEMDDIPTRLAKLESDVGHIREDVRETKGDVKDLRRDGERDFRILFGALIVATIGLAGLMARGFGWL